MSGHSDVLFSCGLGIIIAMVLVWLLSLVLEDASIVDIFWGAGFVGVAWLASTIGDGNSDRAGLVTALITIWGLRLTLFLGWRNHSTGEDPRYQAIRRRTGDSFPVKSLATVFLLQGIVMFVVSLPVQLSTTPAEPELGLLAVVGVIVWGIGLFFETVGDTQLARFRHDPGNGSHVLDTGLWGLTRHPNYFGDACVWWGIWLVTAETNDARFGIVGPLLMSFMLMRGSGVPILERSIEKRRPGYTDYIDRTPAFFPRLPRRPR